MYIRVAEIVRVIFHEEVTDFFLKSRDRRHGDSSASIQNKSISLAVVIGMC